ncbi:MAG: hypothetical protein DMG71_00820, partial [Acidobacteria bacterium]
MVTARADQQIGTSSGPQQIRVQNSGSAPVNVTSIEVSGDYLQTNNCGASLSVGSVCTINVTFAPTSTGTRSGTVSITDDASGSPQMVSLTGNAVSLP